MIENPKENGKSKKLVKKKKNRFLKSKFLVFLIALVIGSTYTYVYLELKPTYLQIREGYNTATTFMQIRAYQGDVVPTASYQAKEPNEPKNSLESEIAPATSSPTVLSIVDNVYQLESSSGLNDQKCERLGKHNGYGFGQWEGHNTCFSSDDETREQVIKWFENKLKVMTLEQALQLYSGNSLSYVDNFNSLT